MGAKLEYRIHDKREVCNIGNGFELTNGREEGSPLENVIETQKKGRIRNGHEKPVGKGQGRDTEYSLRSGREEKRRIQGGVNINEKSL